jgi:hypothetical protein
MTVAPNTAVDAKIIWLGVLDQPSDTVLDAQFCQADSSVKASVFPTAHPTELMDFVRDQGRSGFRITKNV